MKVNRFSPWMVAGLLPLMAISAEAHFLFIRVEPATGAGAPQAHVFFSEQATAGDPLFVDKIDSTKLWQAGTAGRFEPLVVNKASDRLTAALTDNRPGVVVGFCEYGVLARRAVFAALLSEGHRGRPAATQVDPAAREECAGDHGHV